jgi:hypothetical protein
MLTGVTRLGADMPNPGVTARAGGLFAIAPFSF